MTAYTLDDIRQLDEAAVTLSDIATATGSEYLAAHYRAKARIAQARAQEARAELVKRPLSDNAWRMQMDPPSDCSVPVEGPALRRSQVQAYRNRCAVFRQARAARRRGDMNHYWDLINRFKSLTKAAQ